MSSAKDVFIRCDELDALPDENRRNYLFELEWLAENLPRGANVLQVGSMDGMRALRMLEVRHDLRITGLEIEADLVSLATQTLRKRGLNAQFIHGDITAPPPSVEIYSHVLCLNNTLGYIANYEKAIEEMRKRGETTVVSVYGEQFDNDLAKRYFGAIGLSVRRLSGDTIYFDDFSPVRRFARETVSAWGGVVTKSPIGYLSVLVS